MKRNKAVASVRAFLPHDKSLLDILDICNLNPDKSWNAWIDEEGNKLILKENKISIRKKNQSFISKTSDIYRYSNPRNFLSWSKWCMLVKGLSNNKAFSLLFLFGVDSRLRLSIIIDGLWKRNSAPLKAGVKLLYLIANNYKNMNYIDHDCCIPDVTIDNNLIKLNKILSFGLQQQNNDIVLNTCYGEHV